MPDPSKLTKPAVVSVPSADKPQHRPEKRPLLGPIAQGVGLLSVVFALFGHGVLIGIATPLQLDPGMLVNSPFDLLMACWKGVVMIMTLGAKKTASEMVWELGAQQLWPVLIAMGGGYLKNGVARNAALDSAQKAASAGYFAYDAEHQKFFMSSMAHAIFGLPPQEYMTLQQWMDIVHPEDRAHVPSLDLDVGGGRTLHVPKALKGVAVFSFKRLCAEARGASDYLAVARHFHTVIIVGIPRMGPENRNEAARFVTLVDALYEYKVKLLASAAAEPDALYVAGDGAFEFERTASRLAEMQSDEYLALGHGQDDTA